MPLDPTGAASNGIAFLVSAYGVYEVIAANCSSPQTMELNAEKRADTLMKYVHVGLGQSAFFVIVAAIIDRPHAKAILAGAVLAGATMYVTYVHAKQTGLASCEEPTETW
jgi:hypothetical protein